MSHDEGPDRGHAWVIAIAACVITMILSGISKMVGILYVAVIETFGVSRQEATLPFTFRKSLRCLAGPIVGVIGQRYGIRTVTLGGAVVASLGAALCFIAPTVGWLAFCWGGIHGLGEAFANTLFQVIVNQYFEKYRATASGIALSGACVGSICFSFLIEALREAYGLHGTFLILSGVILHVIPAGILLKSPNWLRKETKAPPKSFKESIKERPRMYVLPDDYVKSNSEKKMSTISLNPALLEKNAVLSVANLPFKSHSTMNLVENLEKKLEVQKGCDNFAYAMEREINSEKKPLEKRLSIQNIFPTSKESLYDKVPSYYDLQKDSCLKSDLNDEPLKKKEEKQEKTAAEQKSMIESLKAIVRLYKNPVFVLICVCMATYVLIFIPIMTSIVDYSKDKGLPETIGKYLIHAMALGDIIGRLCLGWVTDKEFISIPRYMTLTLVLEGIFIILIPFTYSFAGYLTLLALYSMTAGSMLVRLPILVLKHVKKEEHSVAMGCYGFASGLVPLAVPGLIGPIVGVVGQRYGIRAVTFCGGVVASLGAALCCIAPNIVWLAVFWGGIHGFGFAFANTLFQVVVNQYFQKYRATASGIALSGACVGSFVFPVMIETILDTFGLSGGFLILGGVVMHVLPPSLLLKSPPWIENPEKYARLKALKMMQESVETLDENVQDSPPEEDGEEEHLREWRGLMRSTSLNNCPVEEMAICSTTRSLKGSTGNLATFTNQNFGRMSEKKRCKRNVICTLYKITETPQLSRRNSSMNGSTEVITQASPIPTISGAIENKSNINSSTTGEKSSKASPNNQTSVMESIRGIGKVYTNPAYVLINVCMTTYVVIFIPILTVIVDYGKDKEIAESYGKYLINAMAMGDLIGRLCFGWVTDRNFLTIPVFITLAFIFQGVFISLFPLATDLYSFMALLTLYGVAAGTILVHFPLLVLRYVDMNLQSVAMGCVGFLSGIISFAIPPMIGHFRDRVGSYDGMFYLTGAISVVSGGFWLLEPFLLKIHREKENQNKILKNEKLKQEQTFEQCKSEGIISNVNGQKSS